MCDNFFLLLACSKDLFVNKFHVTYILNQSDLRGKMSFDSTSNELQHL